MKKKIFTKKLYNTKKSAIFILYALMLFNCQYIHSQQRQFVVRFNHGLLSADAINNESLQKEKLAAFLNGQGRIIVDSLRLSTGIDFKELSTQKMFHNWRTDDTVSISRQGAKVYIPPFWATFLVEAPDSLGDRRFFQTMGNAYPLVVYIDPPLQVELLNVPNDTMYHYQQSLMDTSDFVGGTNVAAAWNIETGKRHIKVGVFDTGIDTLHPDIKVLTGDSHFYSSEIVPPVPMGHGYDNVGHGTSVAGIIGARRNNTTGIAGIAGGDGNDTTGISLIDFKIGDLPSVAAMEGDWISIGLINSARSAGSYYNWYSYLEDHPNTHVDGYFTSHMPGYGVHVNNHSYSMKFASPKPDGSKDLLTDNLLPDWGPDIFHPVCHLCNEAYLFALQNGVVNVIARGNGFVGDPELVAKDNVPQRLDDSWVISVGASGTDGERLNFTYINGQYTSNTAPGEHWFSPTGVNMDLLAPGSLVNVSSLRSTTMVPLNTIDPYRRFNGTSASAPHVTGVVALMLSYYNKPCYSNKNLDPADVEYILQKSAVDLNTPGYDNLSGWGRLDALKALQMIEYPKYQIIHPQSAPTNVQLVEQDTIHVYLKDPIYSSYNGPIGSNQPLFATLNRTYKVEKRKYNITYDFSEYLAPPLSSSSAELLDVWVRHSQTNSLRELQDTFVISSSWPTSSFFMDTFKIEPDAQIVNFDPIAGTITLEGYYYQFLGFYSGTQPFSGVFNPVNVWYPINPTIQAPKMAYSIYIHDSLATGVNFPCDSANILVDQYASITTLEQEDVVAIYPNPGQNEVTVKLQSQQLIEKVMLLDLAGRVVTEKFVQKNNTVRVATEALETGTYIVAVYLENGKIVTKKWIKL